MNTADFCKKYAAKKNPVTPEVKKVLNEVIDAIHSVDERINVGVPNIYMIDASLDELNKFKIYNLYYVLDGSIYISTLLDVNSFSFFHNLLFEILNYLHYHDHIRPIVFKYSFQEALNEYLTQWVLNNCNKFKDLSLEEYNKQIDDILSKSKFSDNLNFFMNYIKNLNLNNTELFDAYINADMLYFYSVITDYCLEENPSYFL